MEGKSPDPPDDSKDGNEENNKNTKLVFRLKIKPLYTQNFSTCSAIKLLKAEVKFGIYFFLTIGFPF